MDALRKKEIKKSEKKIWEMFNFNSKSIFDL